MWLPDLSWNNCSGLLRRSLVFLRILPVAGCIFTIAPLFAAVYSCAVLFRGVIRTLSGRNGSDRPTASRPVLRVYIRFWSPA